MKDFKKAYIPLDQIESVRAEVLAKWRLGDTEMRKLVPAKTEKEAIILIEGVIKGEAQECKIYQNDTYQVSVRDLGGAVHLSIKRLDRAVIHDWRDLQEIKNKIVGPECEAVELYPAESRVLDTANQYHLWASKDPKFRFQFGFDIGHKSDSKIGNSVNRPFDA